ncbi:MAG: SMI1/KNR4 family protein [Phycisphaeraceae bacterium]
MATQILDSYTPTTPQHLSDFENRFDVSLPDDYKKFLLATNGGRPTPDGLIVPKWPGHSTRVHYFFGLHDGEHNNLSSWTGGLIDRLPEGCVPIGVDMGGNFLVLATQDERCGHVYYWDASPDYDLSTAEGTLFLVSSGIQSLIDALTEDAL